jgi:hypothetical protein
VQLAVSWIPIFCRAIIASGCGGSGDPEPCAGSTCTQVGGDPRCDDTGLVVQYCVETEAGCIDWTDTLDCAEQQKVCDSGTASCIAICQEGDLRCGTSGVTVERCVQGSWGELLVCDGVCFPEAVRCLPKASCTALGSALGANVATGTIDGEQNDMGLCDSQAGQDVCFTWQAPAAGMYRFTTEGSTYNAGLGISWEGGSAAECLGQYQPGGDCPVIYRDLDQSEWLVIALDAVAGAGAGDYALSIEQVPACTPFETRCSRSRQETCTSGGSWDIQMFCDNGCNPAGTACNP